MELALSNIGWDAQYDRQIYDLMGKYRFSGLEIAPTRIFPKTPYDRLKDAKEWRLGLKNRHGFVIPSMQSIWYGREEKIFGQNKDRQFLLDYTKRAIDYASAIECNNLVFGCPRNRQLPEGASPESAVAFFRELGEYAAEKGTAIGIEANPPIYNTNFINDTASALDLIRKVDSVGFLLNLDIGTMIENNESVEELRGNVPMINHVHISEPYLKPIVEREIHRQLKDLLLEENYQGFVSIEMGRVDNLQIIENSLVYVKEIFGS